jgi:hypothetical protein
VYIASLFYTEQRPQIGNNKILKTNLLRTMNDNYQLLGTRLGTWLKIARQQSYLWIVLFVLFGISQVQAQISVTVSNETNTTPNLNATYPSLALALDDLNAVTAMSGPVTLTLSGSETAPEKGFTLGSATLNAALSATNTLTLSGSGVTTINAGVGTATPGSALPDGMLKLVGADWVTLNGITFTDSNVTNPATMEFGVALFKLSATDGAQNNTIVNCVFNMQRVNNASGSGPMADGSAAITLLNAVPTAAATNLLSLTAASGSNSFNKIYGNTINGGNTGINLSGFAALTPFVASDYGNDVGGNSIATGNTLLNFGGGGTTAPAVGIRTLNQRDLNVSYNILNNNNGSGVNHATTLRGIFVNTSTSASSTINSNNVVVSGGGTTSLVEAISNASGSTAASNTVNINDNTIRFSYTTATSGVFTAINNSSTAATVNINNNDIQQLGSTNYPSTGTVPVIAGGSPGGTLNINNNSIANFTMTGASGTLRAITAGTPTTLWNVNDNIIENLSYTTAGSSGSIDGIYNLASAQAIAINNNTIRNFSTPGTGTLQGIYVWTSSGTQKNCNNNAVYNFSTSAGGVGGATMNGIRWAVGPIELSGNQVYNLNSTGSTGGTGGAISGILVSGGSTNLNTIFKNKIYNLSSTSTNPVVSGILISGGTPGSTVFNNIIGDLRAPAANAANPVIGINVTGGTAAQVHFNTVLLNATSTGTNFGSSAISVSTTPTVTLRNNIFVNKSTRNGTGVSTAYRRSSTTLSTYGSDSNNNLFFGAAIFFDGTNTDGSLDDFKARVTTRDINSVTEDPAFVSTSGASGQFLHIDTTVGTLIESGGIPIAGVTDDFDGDLRNVTTPDIGADEFAGTAASVVEINSVAISPSTNQCVATSRLVSANITAGAGAISSVTLNYAYNGVAQTPISMTGGSFTAGSTSTFSATIPVAIPVNAVVTWSVTAVDGVTSKNLAGASYRDEPFFGLNAIASASSEALCIGASTTLSAAILESTTTKVLGNGATTSTSVGQTFFPGGWGGAKTQYIIKASELEALGLLSISSLGFQPTSSGQTYQGFSVSLGHTTQETASTTFITGELTQVYSGTETNNGFTPTANVVNMLAFGTGVGSASSFEWDGTSNLLVSICWSRVPSASTSTGSGMLVDNVGFVSSNYRQRDNLTPAAMCAETSATATNSFRPRFTFDGTFGVRADSVVWSDGTSTVGSTVSPTTPTTYTATLFVDGCSITSNSVIVGVNPLPAAPTASNSTQCGINVPTASVSDVNGFESPIYNWYASEDAETALQSSTANTFAGSIDATTTFYVSVVNPSTLCESAKVAVTVTVVPPTPLTLNPASGVTCVGQPIVLSASSANLSYNYTWTVSPQAGSGVLGTLFGSSQTITPTASGTYVFTVTAADAVCTVIEEITLQVNGLPVLNDVTTNDSSLCENQIATLNAVVPTINTGTGAALVPMTGATQVLASGNDDTVTATDIAIGFDFVFNGVTYSQCRISPDGWIRLGGGEATNQFSNSVTSTTNIPKLYPYWDDLATGTNGNVSTLVVGTAPNRIFVVEWFVTVPRNTTGAANSTFQALLYEGTNRVEYRYGAMGPATSQSASVGYTIDDTTYSSITLTTNETSTTVANNSNAIVPQAGRFFNFDPVLSNVTWTPLTDLYSDSDATVAYTGEATSLVYAKITADRTYTARSTDDNGCFSEYSVALTYLGEFIEPITGGASAMCLGAATVVDFNTASVQASWESSNTEVATINANGVVTALSAGTTTIRAFFFNELTGCTSYAANPQELTVYAPVAFDLGAANGGQPLNSSILPGGNTSFTVNTTGNVSGYQWFQSTNGVTFSPLANDAVFSGVSTATLTVTNAPETLNNTYYRCVVSAFSPCAPSIQSEFAFLSVANLSITSNPVSTTICSSGLNAGTAIFTVGIGGPTDLIVWELFDGNDWIVIEDQGLSFGGVTFGGDVFSSTLEINGLTSVNNEWKVRANGLLFDPETIVTSNEATVTVNNAAQVAASPDNKVVCYSGGVSTFTVQSSGGTGFQWQYSADGETWTNVANATPVGASYTGGTTATLTVTTTGAVASDGLFYYRARVNSPTPCEPAFSQAATLTVNNPQIAITASATSICSPGNEPVKLTASGGVTYSWAPAATLSASTGFEVFANPTQTTTYTVTATDATGCVKTATVTVVVYPAVVASISSPTDEVCEGDTVSLNALTNSSLKVKDYAFQSLSGTYQEVSAGATTIPGVQADTFISTAQPIGFSFIYEGQEYSQFKMSSNGFLSLNMTGSSSLTTNDLSTLNSTSRPIIAPLWDDLDGRATGGSVAAYEVTGVAPNRVLTVEWRNFEWNFASTTPVISFQAKLYESTNIIEFVYRSETGAVNNGSASIGLNSITGSGTGSYINVTNVATATVSSTTSTTNINTKPATGTIYRFSPPVYTYEWTSEPAGFTSNLQNPSVVVSETTTYTVVVTANTGCSDTATKTLTVSSGVTITEQPEAVGPLCQGVNTSFSVVASGPSLQYQWRKDGLAIEGNASASTATLVLNGVLPSQSGTYDVLITPACGESQLSASQSLTVYPTPTLEPIANQNYCNDEIAGATPLSGTPSGVTYDIVGGAAVGLADQFGVTEIPSFAVIIGTATVTVTPNANGCAGTPRTFTITVSQKPSDISLNTYSDAICSIDNGVLLTASGGFDVAGTLLRQDFNSGLQGWTVTNGSLSPAQSNWAIVQSPFTLTSGGAGTFANFSTQDGGGFLFSNADAGGSGSTTNTIITSPSFSTLGATTSVLTFEHIYRFWSSGDATVRVEISTNDGSTWLPLNSYLGTTQGTITNDAQATTQVSLSLNSYLNQPNVRIRFNYVSTWGYYWLLDNVRVSGPSQGAITWSPTEGLYTDAAATMPYQGGAAMSVYARPATTQSFVASVNSSNGCSTSSEPVVINVTQATQWYADVDGDGYGDENNPTNFLSCNLSEPGFSSVAGDCNDNNALINPGVAEICFDGIDNNCDGSLFADCTPIVVNITSNVCGSVNNGLNNTIQCNQVNLGPGFVIGYRFEVTNTETGEVRTIDRNIHHFKLTMFGDDFYNYGTTYSIRVAVIINGEVQPYNGTTCSITTTSVGSTSIVASQCGSTLVTMSSSINAVAVNPTPSKYRFRVARADAPTTFYYVERTVPNFNLTLVEGLPLTFDTEYLVSVQIRVKLAGFESWSQWSATSCSVFTPAAPTTALTEADCEFVATSNTDVIHATPVPGATMYRFLLLGFDFDANDDMIIVYEQFVDTPNPYFTLDMFTGLIPGVNYSVSVAVELFGSFTPYGKECSVTTPTVAGCIVTTSFGSLTPTCTGALQTISSCTFAGEFNTVTLTAANNYTFSSSIVTDFLTITTTDGVILAAGVQPLTFTPFASGAYRLHVTTNSSCGTQSSCRATRVTCSSGFTRQTPTRDDAAAATTETSVTVDFKAVGYPNPYVDYFMLDVRSNSTETVRYAIYDMTGRLLESKELKHSELESYRLGSAYPSGIYNVIVIQEDQTQTIRMVKK